MKAIFLGSISVLVDTSEMQRDAFNRAFAEAGLDWHWSADSYRGMLASSGGRDRIKTYAVQQGTEVDAAALHARKTEIFQMKLRQGGLSLRDETAHLMKYAAKQDLKVAFVSGTARESLEALLDGFGGADALGLSLVTSGDDADAPKPDPELYLYALKALDLDAADVIAVEDNRPGVDAAEAAGIRCLVYPNANTRDQNFGTADHVRTLRDRLAA